MEKYLKKSITAPSAVTGEPKLFNKERLIGRGGTGVVATYRASDGENTSNVATVTITVEDSPHISIELMQQGSEADGSATTAVP